MSWKILLIQGRVAQMVRAELKMLVSQVRVLPPPQTLGGSIRATGRKAEY